ncbi:protein of unknown function [Moritella yayanosii]|uniref:Uncharacterized protein n=1 Tax=Moritella yayanosii TaxID=69539 RepID=A0A330LMC3_9GAMM|nr:protein of unknown function [Moritella yayanosii]
MRICKFEIRIFCEILYFVKCHNITQLFIFKVKCVIYVTELVGCFVFVFQNIRVIR